MPVRVRVCASGADRAVTCVRLRTPLPRTPAANGLVVGASQRRSQWKSQALRSRVAPSLALDSLSPGRSARCASLLLEGYGGHSVP